MAAVTSAVIAVAGAGMNIAGGIASKKAARKAAMEAANALSRAKKQLSITRSEELQVPLESYELQQQALAAGQQQAIEGLRESGQRAVQGGLPALQAQVQAGAEDIRQDQAQAIYDREKMIVEEKKTADQQLAGLELQTAQGAQMAAAQAEERSGQQIAAGVQGLASAGLSAYTQSDLYSSRQGELAGAQKLMDSGVNVGGATNARQASRFLQGAGYTGAELQGIGAGYRIKQDPLQPLPLQTAGIQGMGIQPINFSGLTIR